MPQHRGSIIQCYEIFNNFTDLQKNWFVTFPLFIYQSNWFIVNIWLCVLERRQVSRAKYRSSRLQMFFKKGVFKNFLISPSGLHITVVLSPIHFFQLFGEILLEYWLSNFQFCAEMKPANCYSSVVHQLYHRLTSKTTF